MRENFFRIGLGINDDWINLSQYMYFVQKSKRLKIVQGRPKGFTVQWRLS